MNAIDTNGRKYVAVKRFTPAGKYQDRTTGQRYDLVKKYI